ncbi:MAG: CoA-binding protein [Phaeodactylibacter sp.]|nr:CoA-binding protein [Phaeodactylibacter sp.]MCB9264618.1 CoA-binding protein [Lewinellaceae bacterium]MCB9287279.1 CoA-binding protein [Lewinellaceae bacterium]
MKKTLVLGASTNPIRYSNAAVRRLTQGGFEVIPIGLQEGDISGVHIQKGQPALEDIHTITLYLNPQRQKEYYDYILSLSPRRIIFNPGTENPELMQLAREKGIEVEIACTLVMLAVGQY